MTAMTLSLHVKSRRKLLQAYLKRRPNEEWTLQQMLILYQSVYTKLFQDYNLSKLELMQANLRVYNFTNTTVIGSCVLCHESKTLIFNIKDPKGSAFLSCFETLH